MQLAARVCWPMRSTHSLPHHWAERLGCPLYVKMCCGYGECSAKENISTNTRHVSCCVVMGGFLTSTHIQNIMLLLLCSCCDCIFDGFAITKSLKAELFSWFFQGQWYCNVCLWAMQKHFTFQCHNQWKLQCTVLVLRLTRLLWPAWLPDHQLNWDAGNSSSAPASLLDYCCPPPPQDQLPVSDHHPHPSSTVVWQTAHANCTHILLVYHWLCCC